MNLNIENIVRSAAIVAVGLPISLAVTNLVNTTDKLAKLGLIKPSETQIVDEFKAELYRPCINYYVSEVDSKLERTAKNDIEEVMGGAVDHNSLCEWIVK